MIEFIIYSIGVILSVVLIVIFEKRGNIKGETPFVIFSLFSWACVYVLAIFILYIFLKRK